MTRLVQREMHCPCGNLKVLALGLCSTCYTLKRRRARRQAVLELQGQLSSYRESNPDIQISLIAHSHGGNIAMALVAPAGHSHIVQLPATKTRSLMHSTTYHNAEAITATVRWVSAQP